jgi:hypothetical protein
VNVAFDEIGCVIVPIVNYQSMLGMAVKPVRVNKGRYQNFGRTIPANHLGNHVVIVSANVSAGRACGGEMPEAFEDANRHRFNGNRAIVKRCPESSNQKSKLRALSGRMYHDDDPSSDVYPLVLLRCPLPRGLKQLLLCRPAVLRFGHSRVL